jgi:hypothetical protein
MPIEHTFREEYSHEEAERDACDGEDEHEKEE